jgi:hypothetical protein
VIYSRSRWLTIAAIANGLFLPMKYRFEKHYTREEAQSLVPQLRAWLADLNRLREEVERYDKRLSGLNIEGQDTGGETVNSWIRALAGMQNILAEFQRREIFIKDLSRGLIDFPAIIGGREVFLCWEADEDTVEFWHDLNTGYDGREKLG